MTTPSSAHRAPHVSVTQLHSADADIVVQNDQSRTYIHPHMTFREVSKIALDLYSKRDFDVFKNEFEQMRQRESTGLGLLTQIEILDKKNEPTLEGVFSLMNKEQSQRFQNEFFDAMVPHWIARQDLWKNANNTHHGEYQFKMQGSWFNKMLFKFVARMLSEKDFVDLVVMTSKSTWVDDDKKTISMRATFK